MEKTDKYWLALEAYVYVEKKANRILLYNTLDGNCLVSDDPDVTALVGAIYTPGHTGVVEVSSRMLQKKEIREFVTKMRELFIGDLYEQSLFREKPVQPYPLLKFNRDVRKLKKIEGRSIGENILSTLCKVDIYLDKPGCKEIFPPRLLEGLLRQIEFCKLDSLRLHLFDEERYPHWETVERLLEHSRHRSQYVFPLASFHPEVWKKTGADRDIVFEVSRELYAENRLRERLEALPEPVRKTALYLFPVASEADLDCLLSVVEEFGLESYKMNPVYTGDNLPFLEEAVFMDEEDLASEPVSLKEIYTHQTLNAHDFGRLVFYPDGNVYANEHTPKIGNLHTESLFTLVYKELDEGKNWFRVREEAPCSECLYQWICPSPSDLERTIGKPDLCRAKL